MITSTSLRHPVVAANVYAAMCLATTEAVTTCKTTAGDELVTIAYMRGEPQAFSFFKDGVDITDEFVKALRGSVAT